MARVIHGRHVYKAVWISEIDEYFNEVIRRIHMLLVLRKITTSLGMFHVRNNV